MRTYIRHGMEKSTNIVAEREERQRQRNKNPGAFTNLTPMAFKGKTGPRPE